MSYEKVTSTDVARKAGVSQSAVSRVFTPGASASKQTVEKVKAAASELGYRPNVLARSLITGQSRIIGLVVAYLNNQFYPDVLEKLSQRLQDEGFHVLVFMASNEAANIDRVVEGILDYQVDGIIAASVAVSGDLAARCQAAGVPIVLFNRSQERGDHSAVTSDNYAGGGVAAEHLIALGHRNIGYIAGWEGASTQLEREAGFRDALAGYGLKPTHREIGDFNAERAQAATRRMFAKDDRPTAVFVANDHMAFSVMDVLRFELGISIPNEVSVIGFDDVPVANWPAYDLTTVRQPANRMAHETVKALLEKIHDPKARSRRIAIETTLIERGSTAKIGIHNERL
jgi:DNA-binding LacI/PurR family transcriptional regulator